MQVNDDVRAALFAVTADALGQPVAAEDTFFDLGADSLSVIEVAAALEEKFGSPVDAGWLMTGESLDRIAATLAEQLRSAETVDPKPAEAAVE